nr:putative ribonuclease H-like domain-containing protein [Tanacetum cinerariifolium]
MRVEESSSWVKGHRHIGCWEECVEVFDLSAEFEDCSDNSINELNAAGTIVLTVGQNSPNSTNTFSAVELEDITYSDDVGAEADFNNLETSITISPIPTTRVHKDHPVSQIISDLSSTTQTRSMTRVEEPKRKKSNWYKKDERGIVVRNKERLVTQGHTQEEGIDDEKVFAPVARIEAIRLFLAYASFMGFMVYRMDVKSAFLYRTIEKEVYVCQPQGFKDPNHPDKVYKVVKALYGLHQAPRACQDKYIAEILRKFRLTEGKSASTPIDTEKPLLKDPDGEDVDVHTYRSMIGSLMYLTSSRADIMFADSPFDIVAYSDTDYAGASLDRKSTTGGCQFLGCRLISWQCKKQKVVATSSTEAEYVVNDVTRLQALVDRKKVVVTEATIKEALCLDDAEGRKFNFSKCIFDSVVRNVDNTTKFYMYLRFLQLIIRKQVGDLSTHTTKYTLPALTQKKIDEEGAADEHVEEVDTSDAAQGDDSAARGEVPIVAEEQSIPSPTPPTPPPQPPQDIPLISQHLEFDKVAQALEITKLKRRVRKLEKRNKVRVLKLKRLQKVGTSRRVETSDDIVMDDESNQGRMIAKMDQDDVVILEDDKEEDKNVADAIKDVKKDKVDESAKDQGRQAESQAEIYKIDMDHANKVLSMQEDETELAEVQEVVDVVTIAKLTTEVITTASETVTTAIAAAPSRRRKGVVIRDPEEESTTSTIIPAETKSKDKGKGILVEEPKPLKKKQQTEQDKQYARELHAELNKDIDWDEAIDHVKLKAKEDPAVKRYQAIKRKPQTEAQARKNIMMYLKNVAGFKLDYFKGMSYDDIRPIFEAKFNSNVAFLLKTKEQIEEDENKALQTINETPVERAAKRRKLDEEVEDLKIHLQIVPNEMMMSILKPFHLLERSLLWIMRSLK